MLKPHEKRLIDATLEWWAVRRDGLSLEQHILNPETSCPTYRGKKLARHIGEYLAAEQKQSTPKPKRKVAKKKKAVPKRKAAPKRKTKVAAKKKASPKRKKAVGW